MKNPLNKLERVPLRGAWKHEANDFTPWLSQKAPHLHPQTSRPQHLRNVATWRPSSPIEDKAQWSHYLDWYVQRIVKMNTVFRPVIQGLT